MAETPNQGPLAVGQKFLKYTIREQIGRGGHAWVYHGHDPFLDNEVAIKILHRHGGVTEDMLRRGQAEAKLLFRLKHPNIVEVQDAGISEEGLLYIVMELLRGKSLRDVMRARGAIPVREALDLVLDLTEGVEAAHSFGAIHRDLKPENVFILADGTCKILDFGIAKVVDAAGMTTERDVLHGTILYISPEQLEGHRATPRSDLYSLGLVLFEILHGRHPLLLKNQTPTVRELSLMQIGFRPPRLDELNPQIPRHVARIVERLLIKSPLQRTQSTQELRAALVESRRRLLEDEASVSTSVQRPRVDHQSPLIQDTERIPLAMLPDQVSSNPLKLPAPAPTRTEPIALNQPEPEPEPAWPGPTRTATVPPLITPIRQTLERGGRMEREVRRLRAARALGAGALVGACLGGGYLWLHSRAEKPVIAAEPHVASVIVAEPTPAVVVASATREAFPTEQPSSVAVAPKAPPPVPVATHARTPRGPAASKPMTPVASSQHADSDAHNDTSPARKVWIE